MMIGIISSVCAMSSMAAPSDHHYKQDSHQFNKKHMPSKAGFSHKQSSKHFNQKDRRDQHQFNNQNHKSDRYKHDVDRQISPKHR